MGLNLDSQYFLRYAAAIFFTRNIELWKVSKSAYDYEFA
jgi:hypothetical protein